MKFIIQTADKTETLATGKLKYFERTDRLLGSLNNKTATGRVKVPGETVSIGFKFPNVYTTSSEELAKRTIATQIRLWTQELYIDKHNGSTTGQAEDEAMIKKLGSAIIVGVPGPEDEE